MKRVKRIANIAVNIVIAVVYYPLVGVAKISSCLAEMLLKANGKINDWFTFGINSNLSWYNPNEHDESNIEDVECEEVSE